MARTALPDVARAVEGVQRATIAAGTDPDGKPWPLTKDGDKALQNAAAAVEVTHTAGAVVIRVSGPEELHHAGKARGHVQRKIIPTGPLPSRMSRAIGETLDRVFVRITGGVR